MGNTLSAFTPEYWSARMQRLLSKQLVARRITSFEEQATLRDGDTVNRPYMGDFHVNDYTKGTDATVQDLSGGNEYLTVATTKEITFYYDNIDKIQNAYPVVNKHQARAAYALANEIDGDVLDEIVNATTDLDDGDIGGTAGNPISASVSNVAKIFSRAKAVMKNNYVEAGTPWSAVIDNDMASVIEQSGLANGFNLSDAIFKNGYAWPFMGWDIVVSDNLRNTVSLGVATNISDGDTIVIAGVTFTFVTTLGTTPGNVHICSSAAKTVTNFVTALNALGTSIPSATDAGYVAISDDDRNTLSQKRMVATDNTTAIGFTFSGTVVLSETLTAVADGFGDTTVHSYFCQNGATDMVIQQEVTSQMNKAPLKTGYYFLNYDLYGKKTFLEGTKRMLDVKFKSL